MKKILIALTVLIAFIVAAPTLVNARDITNLQLVAHATAQEIAGNVTAKVT